MITSGSTRDVSNASAHARGRGGRSSRSCRRRSDKRDTSEMGTSPRNLGSAIAANPTGGAHATCAQQPPSIGSARSPRSSWWQQQDFTARSFACGQAHFGAVERSTRCAAARAVRGPMELRRTTERTSTRAAKRTQRSARRDQVGRPLRIDVVEHTSRPAIFHASRGRRSRPPNSVQRLLSAAFRTPHRAGVTCCSGNRRASTGPASAITRW